MRHARVFFAGQLALLVLLAVLTQCPASAMSGWFGGGRKKLLGDGPSSDDALPETHQEKMARLREEAEKSRKKHEAQNARRTKLQNLDRQLPALEERIRGAKELDKVELVKEYASINVLLATVADYYLEDELPKLGKNDERSLSKMLLQANACLELAKHKLIKPLYAVNEALLEAEKGPRKPDSEPGIQSPAGRSLPPLLEGFEKLPTWKHLEAYAERLERDLKKFGEYKPMSNDQALKSLAGVIRASGHNLWKVEVGSKLVSISLWNQILAVTYKHLEELNKQEPTGARLK